MIAGVIKGRPGTFVVIMSRERQRRTLLLFGALTIMHATLGNAWSAALNGVMCGFWLAMAIINRRGR